MFQVLLPSHESHVLPSVLGLMRALEREEVRSVLSPLRKRSWRGLAKVAGTCGLRRLPLRGRREAAFFHLNHPWRNALYPYCLSGQCVTYSFDCWASSYDEWEAFFKTNRVELAFISAKQSTAVMARRCADTQFRWLPEAVDPEEYKSDVPLANRSIDVLEMGRRFDRYHQAIVDPLRTGGWCHAYPSMDRGLVFQTHAAMKAALGNAKVSICFPQSLTHPERAGDVETATLRYFESMAAKCLVVGHCPRELAEMFGYNPVIEVRLEKAAKQLIMEILPHIGRYQALVHRNYERLLEVGTVRSRAGAIVSALRAVEKLQRG